VTGTVIGDLSSRIARRGSENPAILR